MGSPEKRNTETFSYVVGFVCQQGKCTGAVSLESTHSAYISYIFILYFKQYHINKNAVFSYVSRLTIVIYVTCSGMNPLK